MHGVSLELYTRYYNSFHTLKRRPQQMVVFSADVYPKGYEIDYEDYKNYQL